MGVFIRFLTLAVAGSALLFAQAPSGRLSGRVLGDDGSSIQNALVQLKFEPLSSSRLSRDPGQYASRTGPGGQFSFDSLPAGRYILCARTDGGQWLNPCEWTVSAPAATITPDSPTAKTDIVMVKGTELLIQFADPDGALASRATKGLSPGLLVMLGSGMFVRMIPVAETSGKSRTHKIVIPPNTRFDVILHAPQHQLKDNGGKTLSGSEATRIPVIAGKGDTIAPIRFTISPR